MKEKVPQRLLVFVPPRSSMAGRSQLAIQHRGRLRRARQTPAPRPHADRAAAEGEFGRSSSSTRATSSSPRSKLRSSPRASSAWRCRTSSRSGCSPIRRTVTSPSGTRAAAATRRRRCPKIPVAVVDRGLLTRALDALTESGYRVRAAYSEIYTVPPPAAGVLSVRIGRGRGIARSGRARRVCIRHRATTFRPHWRWRHGSLASSASTPTAGTHRASAALAEGLGVQIDVHADEVDLASTDGAVDLLQGAFAQGGMMGSLTGGRCCQPSPAAPARAARVGCAAVVVAVAGMNIYYLKLESESRAIRSQMEASFRSELPADHGDRRPDRTDQAPDRRSSIAVRHSVRERLLGAQCAHSPAAVDRSRRQRRGHGVPRRRAESEVRAGHGRQPALQNTLRSAAVQQGLADPLRRRRHRPHHGGGDVTWKH